MRRNKYKQNLNKPEKQSFLRNHADTLAIMGLNLAIAGLLISLYISNLSNITAANSRIDTLHVMFYDLLKENMKWRNFQSD